MKRVFLIVLDSLGIGAAPDARDFGDEGANTLKRISGSKEFNIPNLIRLGVGCIDGVDYLKKCDTPPAIIARLEEISRGKDTTVGHWELMGAISEKPLPTYPHGFPNQIIDAFESAIGKRTLCNLPYSGTEVLKDYGKEHIKTGYPIVYTSADSVFQIAAHEDIIPPKELYRYCEAARAILVGEHSVGRVIARPFTEKDGSFVRTANRHDFSLEPPKRTLLDTLKAEGFDVISVGKICDIFAGRGITESNPTKSNMHGFEITSKLLDRDFHGLAFVNLVEFDSHYGHRQDIDGYAKALSEFDLWLGSFLDGLQDGDMLIITADHGCDPGDDSTDHTREYIPLIMHQKGECYKNLGTLRGFHTVAGAVATALGTKFTPG